MKAIDSEQINLEMPSETLNNLIECYYFDNEQKKKYVKIIDENNKKIKNIMSLENITEHIYKNIKAIFSKTERKGYDEKLLLELVKKNLNEEQLKEIVKTKEYVDIEILENNLYNKEFNGAFILPALTKKETFVLNIKKIK